MGHTNVFCRIISSLSLVNHYFLHPSPNLHNKTLKFCGTVARVTRKNLQIQFFENIDSTPEIVQKPFPVPYQITWLICIVSYDLC